MATRGFTAEEENVSRLFLVDAQGFDEAKTVEILEAAARVARDKNVSVYDAVAAVATAVLGHPRRLQRLGFEPPANRHDVLDHIRKRLPRP